MKTITVTIEVTDEQAESLDRLKLIGSSILDTLWKREETGNLHMVRTTEYYTQLWTIEPNGYVQVEQMDADDAAEGWETVQAMLPDGTED